MTLDEVADLVEAAGTFPARAVVLTIDDADQSVYKLAWPLLEKYGMRAHLFVPTAKVGSTWSELDVCTWDQLTRDGGLRAHHRRIPHPRPALQGSQRAAAWSRCSCTRTRCPTRPGSGT